MLRERGVDFEEKLVDENDDLVDEIERLTGQLTVPVIVWEDRVEVGIDGEIG